MFVNEYISHTSTCSLYLDQQWFESVLLKLVEKHFCTSPLDWQDRNLVTETEKTHLMVRPCLW